jgi:hypothetical protein
VFEYRWGQEIFLLTKTFIPRLGLCQPFPIQWVRGLLPGIKRPRHEVDQLPLSGADVKNEWSCASAPYIHGMDRDEFALLLLLLLLLLFVV